MKITLFTSNHKRHFYLVNSLLKICDNVNIVIENTSLYHGKKGSFYGISKVKDYYFSKVRMAESKIFKNEYLKFLKKKKINLKTIQFGDLNLLKKKNLKNFLSSDTYIVFGSSFIKGWLLKFLIKNKALNIHMGISPYYKGTDCNFWALYDKKYNYVGSTIHLLSKKLDGGPILFHTIPEFHKDPFFYSMLAVKSAIIGLVNFLKNKKNIKLNIAPQSDKENIKFTKKKNFTDNTIKKFLSRKKILNKNDFINDFPKLVNPFKVINKTFN